MPLEMLSLKRKPDLQAVILGGGKGTRLRPITYKIPKVMVKIKGKPFLLYLLRLLKKKGISKVLLLAGYLGEQIEEYFGDGRRFGLDITYSYDSLLGTGGALKKAAGLIEADFFLLNGDTYLDFDYQGLKDKFNSLGCKGLLCVYTNKKRKIEPNILLGKDNLIVKYDKGSSDGLKEVAAGVGIFKKEVLRLIPKDTFISLEDEIYKKLIQQKELYGLAIDRNFLDIGDFTRLELARNLLR